MVNFGFYVNTYLGDKIPETAFAGALEQAKRTLCKYKRIYKVQGDEFCEDMALCAMAECVYEDAFQSEEVVRRDLGGVSVQYDKKKSLTRKLYEKAMLYLDIYRGCGR